MLGREPEKATRFCPIKDLFNLCGNISTIIKMCFVTLFYFFYLLRLIHQLIKDETVVIFDILFYLMFFVTSLESVNLTRENITT